jgi:hypothetical protein
MKNEQKMTGSFIRKEPRGTQNGALLQANENKYEMSF